MKSDCPVCGASSGAGCKHLALATSATDFIRRAVETCQAEPLWRSICKGGEDFTWLESAFCDRFIRALHWFAGLSYDWRDGAKPGQRDHWVLLWSSEPRGLWWDLRDRLEEEAAQNEAEVEAAVRCPVCGADCAKHSCQHVAFEGDDLRTSEVVGSEALALPESAAAFFERHRRRFPSFVSVESQEWTGGAPGLSGIYTYVFTKDPAALRSEISSLLEGKMKPKVRRTNRRRRSGRWTRSRVNGWRLGGKILFWRSSGRVLKLGAWRCICLIVLLQELPLSRCCWEK